MRRVVVYLRRLWRQEEPTYIFLPPPPEQTFLAPLLPYRSPQAATYWQLRQIRYRQRGKQPSDSFIAYDWMDTCAFSPVRRAGQEYPS
ncbi:MAG: hypothetical protein CV089_08910 [Nitrospira sp. WS110]|nr:hypothetical protein [Nitrospira sp. WS110]